MKFIEDDFEVNKESLFGFIKSFLILLLLAPARFLLTMFTKVLYLPKDVLEKILLASAAVAAFIAIANLGLSVYFGTFKVTSEFFLVSVATTVLIIVSYLLLAMQRIVLYEQMDGMTRRTVEFVGDEELVSTAENDAEVSNTEDERDVVDFDLEVDDEEESTVVNFEKGDEQSEAEDTEEFDSFESNFSSSVFDEIDVPKSEELDIDNAKETEDESTPRNIVSANDVLSFQNHLKEKIDCLVESEKNIGKALSEREIRNILDEMDDSTDPSMFIPEELLQGFPEEMDGLDTFDVDKFDISMIPTNFKALC